MTRSEFIIFALVTAVFLGMAWIEPWLLGVAGLSCMLWMAAAAWSGWRRRRTNGDKIIAGLRDAVDMARQQKPMRAPAAWRGK